MFDATDLEDARRAHAIEMGGDSPEETRYYAWLSAVEKLLDVPTLDGDSATDGYSLDQASDMFDNGDTPDEAAAWFREAMHDIDMECGL